MSPFKLLQDAARAVPAMRYAIAVAGLGAVVAIVAGFGLSPKIAIFGILIVIVFMFILVLFASFAKHGGRSALLLAHVLAWSFTTITFATVVFLFLSFFLSFPKPIDHFFPDSANYTPHREEVVVTFDFDQYSLTAETRSILLDLYEKLVLNPKLKITVESFASLQDYKTSLEDRSEDGSDEIELREYAERIAKHRADSIANFLMRQGLSGSRIAIRPKLYDQPGEAENYNTSMEFTAHPLAKIFVE